MPDVLLPGVTATRVPTARLTQNVLHPEGTDPAGPGEAVLFVHGNVSSALFWQPTLRTVHETGRHRALAVDLRGYGDTDPLPVDARRGVRDWPTTWPHWSTPSASTACTWSAGAWAPASSCSTCSTRRRGWPR